MSETEEFITESMRVTAEPVPNVALLNEIMDLVIEANKHDLWEQGDWIAQARSYATPMVYKGQEFCGTACCFAGWTALNDGWKPSFQKDRDGYVEIILTKGDEQKYGWQSDNIASELLGLTDHQADALFEGSNTLEDLQSIIKRIVNGELIDYPDDYLDDPEEDDDEE